MWMMSMAISLVVSLCAECAQMTEPGQRKNEAFLTIERCEGTTFQTGAEFIRWEFAGQQAKSVSVRLQAFADGYQKDVQQITFANGESVEQFRGDVSVLFEDGAVFGAKGKRAISLIASVKKGFTQRTSINTDSAFVFDAGWMAKGARGHSRGPIGGPADATNILMCRVFARSPLDAEEIVSIVVCKTTDELLKYSKKGRTIVAVSIDWEPRESP